MIVYISSETFPITIILISKLVLPCATQNMHHVHLDLLTLQLPFFCHEIISLSSFVLILIYLWDSCISNISYMLLPESNFGQYISYYFIHEKYIELVYRRSETSNKKRSKKLKITKTIMQKKSFYRCITRKYKNYQTNKWCSNHKWQTKYGEKYIVLISRRSDGIIYASNEKT